MNYQSTTLLHKKPAFMVEFYFNFIFSKDFSAIRSILQHIRTFNLYISHVIHRYVCRYQIFLAWCCHCLCCCGGSKCVSYVFLEHMEHKDLTHMYVILPVCVRLHLFKSPAKGRLKAPEKRMSVSFLVFAFIIFSRPVCK